jgi:hypothetical protein
LSAAGPRAPRTTSQARILDNLRLASRKSDRAALALALDEMRTLAFSPRYWIRYLTLIQHPLARLVDLLVIKQGDKIARQKGWTPAARRARRSAGARSARTASTKTVSAKRPVRSRTGPEQTPLFPGL